MKLDVIVRCVERVLMLRVRCVSLQSLEVREEQKDQVRVWWDEETTWKKRCKKWKGKKKKNGVWW